MKLMVDRKSPAKLQAPMRRLFLLLTFLAWPGFGVDGQEIIRREEVHLLPPPTLRL